MEITESKPEPTKNHQSKNSEESEHTENSIELGTTKKTQVPKSVHEKSRGNVMFLKTHKTASCTIQNILTRYAMTHGLFVGLSPSLSFKYESGQRFNRDFVLPLPSNRTLNMLVHHMRFNKAEIQAIMPRDTIYISILRDPAKQFESAFVYYNAFIEAFRAVSRSKTPLQDWFKNPKK